MERHYLLPEFFTAEETAQWLVKNAKEVVKDTEKRYFTEGEKIEFAQESSLNGREINRLNDVKQAVATFVTKGSTFLNETVIIVFKSQEDESVIVPKEGQEVIIIPASVGTKVLETQRRQNDDLLERQYEVLDVQLYGIPCQESGCMEFFNAEGEHYPDRSHGLTMKEKKMYFGSIANMRRVNEGNVDLSTGELQSAINE